jgi:hypothetical protein
VVVVALVMVVGQQTQTHQTKVLVVVDKVVQAVVVLAQVQQLMA